MAVSQEWASRLALNKMDDSRSSWASCQIRKIAGAHAPGMPGTFSLPPRVSDPDMHHDTCVTHVPWCMPGSLTSSLLWSRRQGKRSRHSRRMRNPQFYVSGKRLMAMTLTFWSQSLRTSGPVLDGLVPGWISNHIPSKVWDKITYLLTVEVWECIGNFIPLLIVDVITYPYRI